MIVCIPVALSNYRCENRYKVQCSNRYRNPEKFPNLYYEVIHNKTFTQFSRIMFKLKLPPELDYESKLVAASDTLDHINKEHAYYNFPFTVSIIYGTTTTRNVTFFDCFESSVILDEIIQMNIVPMLNGVYVTLIYTEININDRYAGQEESHNV